MPQVFVFKPEETETRSMMMNETSNITTLAGFMSQGSFEPGLTHVPTCRLCPSCGKVCHPDNMLRQIAVFKRYEIPN
ncbi:uncharacterized [Tachysurus ichikawai]